MGGGHRTYLIEVGTPHVYLIGVGTPHIPYWGVDTAHTFLGVGTSHNIERKSLAVYRKIVLSDFCLCFVQPEIKPNESKDLYLALHGFL